jgi:antitoxin component YwqK of YwqJK toxin-antitoxin module
MKSLLLVAQMILVTCVFAQTVNVKDVNGKKQGPWQKTYPNSRAFEYKGQFKDDKPVGTFTYFYPSTKVQAVIVHGNNGRSVATMYHENGVVMAQGIYRNQQKDSIWLYYNPSAKLSTKETYSNGKLNGPQLIYYHFENPSDTRVVVAKSTPYVNGVIHGDVIEYFDDNTIKSKVNYVNGKKNGILVINHPTGQPMITERYKDGIQHGWQYAHDASGKVTGKQFYRFGKRIEGKELESYLKQCKEKGIKVE